MYPLWVNALGYRSANSGESMVWIHREIRWWLSHQWISTSISFGGYKLYPSTICIHRCIFLLLLFLLLYSSSLFFYILVASATEFSKLRTSVKRPRFSCNKGAILQNSQHEIRQSKTSHISHSHQTKKHIKQTFFSIAFPAPSLPWGAGQVGCQRQSAVERRGHARGRADAAGDAAGDVTGMGMVGGTIPKIVQLFRLYWQYWHIYIYITIIICIYIYVKGHKGA